MVSRTSLTSGSGAGSTSKAGSTQTTIGTQTGTTSKTGSTSQNATESKVSDYLDPVARKALNDLIRQLSGQQSAVSFWDKGSDKGSGAAAQAKQYSEERLAEINTNQALRNDYTKGAAFGDAQAAMAANLSKALEQSMPVIAAGIDSAGTSGSAMSALLTQQAAENAARTSAELGLQAAISYGQIQTGFGDILERLTSEGDPMTNQLLQALGIAKGASEKTTASSSSSSTSKESSNSTINSMETTTFSGTEDVTAKKAQQSSGYTPIKFPGMSTPGYSATAKAQLEAARKQNGVSSSTPGYSATAKAQLEAARKQNGVSSSSSGGSSTYKGS